jgi:hypothetical protein
MNSSINNLNSFNIFYSAIQEIEQDSNSANNSIDNNNELQELKAQSEKFQFPVLTKPKTDEDLLVRANNKTGNELFNKISNSWQNIGAKKLDFTIQNFGNSNQKKYESLGALKEQLVNQHNTFIEFKDGSIGFKSSAFGEDVRYGIISPNQDQTLEFKNWQQPNQQQIKDLDQAHSIREKMIENIGGFKNFKTTENILDQIEDLKTGSIIDDQGKVSRLLNDEQVKIIEKIEEDLQNQLITGSQEFDFNSLRKTFENLKKNEAIKNFITKTREDDKTRFGLSSSDNNNDKSQMLNQAENEKLLDLKSEILTNLNSQKTDLTAEQKFIKNLAEDYTKEIKKYALNEFENFINHKTNYVAPPPLSNEYLLYTKADPFIKDFYEVFSKETIDSLKDGEKITENVDINNEEVPLTLYKLGNDIFFDYSDEGVAGKLYENSQEYQMLKSNSNNPEAYSEAIPVTRISQEELASDAFVNKENKNLRIFQNNQEIKNIKGSYQLKLKNGAIGYYIYFSDNLILVK